MAADHSAIRLALAAGPRLGWITEPSPITPAEALGSELGLGWLGAKRDDRLPLHGGSKIRKLDRLLATEPFASAPRWVSTGAIGSGHLVAAAAAAQELGRELCALCFWQPPTERVRQSLAFTTTHTAAIRYRSSRVGLFLRYGRAMFGSTWRGHVVIPPGACTPAASLALVEAALELADQVQAGELPAPDRVYAALGTGGTVAGLCVGLGLCGLSTEVRAVAAVERPFATEARVRALIQELVAALSALGLDSVRPAPLVVDRSQMTRGYGIATPASEAAVARFLPSDIPIEAIYTGRAAAALLHDAPALAGRSVLLWQTARSPEPLPAADDWVDRLPPALRRRLMDPVGRRRRRLLSAGVAVGAVVMVGARFTGYDDWPDWDGAVLFEWEALLLVACAEALLPPAPGDAETLRRVAVNVDRYVRAMPSHARRELHAGLLAIEHGTTPLSLRWSRLTECDPDERLEYLESLGRRGGLLRQLYRAARDLCLLGYYQQDATWAALGYDGPLARPTDPDPYLALVASDGVAPPGWTA